MKNIALLLVVLCLALGTGCGKADEKQSSATDADNTARNAEKAPEALAETDPLDQSESEADLRISASIRESVVRDKALSADAHNIKIMTRDGKVTLRGPVETEREKSKIEAYAKLATGVDSVNNMLEVEKN
jgi:hyperosmotically inducible periplasmic protein